MNDVLSRGYRGRAALVSGGMGFIGSTLAIKLVELGASVTILDAMTPEDGGNEFNVEPVRAQVSVVRGDAADESLVARLIEGKDFLFNMAGKISHIESMERPSADLHANTTASLVQLEACRKHNPTIRVVYASTRQVYGPAQYLPVDECHPIAPVDINGIHKYASEQYHSLFGRAYGLRCTSLRLGNTYGPRQLMKHDRHGFTGWFVGLALRGEEIRVFGDGAQRRDFTHVDDVADAFLRTALKEETVGHVFNVGAAQPTRLIDFVETLIGVAGSGRFVRVPFPVEKKRIEIGDIFCQSDRLQEATGWRPTISLRTGLADTVAYARKHAGHYLPTYAS